MSEINKIVFVLVLMILAAIWSCLIYLDGRIDKLNHEICEMQKKQEEKD